MRFWARLVLVALVLAPWAPVADCSATAMSASAAVERASSAGAPACCCDETECCALPDESVAATSHAASMPAHDASDASDAPCCRATNAPAPAVPSPAVESQTAPVSLAIVTPEPFLATSASDDAHRVLTTESPPGSSELDELTTNRLRL